MLTPITIITGYLGAGKTTLLQRIVDHTDKKIAILMNEFGEFAIDSKIVRGKNIDMTELAGGCVCCSLTGEFEAAIAEIREKVNPDLIVIETTGVAEPDAIVGDILESIDGVRLDAIVTVVDADSLKRFPSIGHTGRMQIEMADVLILNKTDLVSEDSLKQIKKQLEEMNQHAIIFEAVKCDVSIDEILDIRSEKKLEKISRDKHIEEDKIEYFVFETDKKMDKDVLETKLSVLPENVIRAKGFVLTKDVPLLLNFVFGRYYLEPFKGNRTHIVFIGKNILKDKDKIISMMEECINV